MSNRTRFSKQPQHYSSRYERKRDSNSTFNSSRTVKELREENNQLIEVIKVLSHSPRLNSLIYLISPVYIYTDYLSIHTA